jgi:hypothetical protein
VLFIRASSAFVEGSSLFSPCARTHTHTCETRTQQPSFKRLMTNPTSLIFRPENFPRVLAAGKHLRQKRFAFRHVLYEMRASDAENGRLLVINCERTLTALSYLACALVSPSLSAPSQPAYYPVVISSGLLRNLYILGDFLHG